MAEAQPLLLGIDVGSSRTKAVLLDAHGGTVASSGVATPFQTSGDHTEATGEAVLDAMEGAVTALADRLEQVAAIGVAGIAESGVPFDASGTALAPIIAWHDRRGRDVATRLEAQFGQDLHRWIGQKLRYVATVAKLGWLLEHGVSRPARWLGVPELCLRSLTGTEATEWSLAGRTGCWDIRTRSWLPDVAEAAGFGMDIFPPVRSAGEAMGEVCREAAERFGLPAGVPVTIAGHDHLVGIVGSGAGGDDLTDSVGSAETVLARTSTLPDLDAAIERSAAVGVFPGGDGWAVLVGAARAGLAVNLAAAALGKSPEELDELAEGASILDAPDLAASLEARDPPALPEGPPGAVWATLLDALAAFTAEAMTRVTAVSGPASRLVVFGGGAQSGPWLAAKARHMPLPVWRSTAPEAVARGAAVFAGIAAGWWADAGAAPPPELQPVPAPDGGRRQ